MKFRSLAFALATAGSLGALTTAGAAVLVLGSGPGNDCYEAAKANRASSEALDSCNDALGVNSSLDVRDRAATYVNRSVLLLDRNSAMAALADTDRALSLQPTMSAAAVNKSAALMLLSRFSEAKSTLDQALPLASGDDLQRGLFNRAMANESLGDVQSAYHDLHRALEINPDFQPARIEIARYQVRNR